MKHLGKPQLLGSAPRPHAASDGSTRDSVSSLDPQPSPSERLQPAPELSIVVPTFNERENIPRLIDTLRAALPDIAWELIIVDDNSPDGTSETAKRIAAADSRIRCIRRVGRRGLAGACLEGILASQAQYVAVMDGDLQHDEGLLLPMLALLRRDAANMVVATRYADGGSAVGLSSQRAWGSRLATKLALRLLKLELSDPMSGFFMLRRELVENIAPKLSTQGFKILLDIAVTARVYSVVWCTVEYEWDEAKAATNFAKHGISFTAAARALEDPRKIEILDDRFDYNEDRIQSLCMDREMSYSS